jgi:hypothetical protein
MERGAEIPGVRNAYCDKEVKMKPWGESWEQRCRGKQSVCSGQPSAGDFDCAAED